MKTIKYENLNLKLEETNLIQLNILQTKKTNPAIFVVIPWLQRAHDCKMQHIQKTYIASTSLMLEAA